MILPSLMARASFVEKLGSTVRIFALTRIVSAFWAVAATQRRNAGRKRMHYSYQGSELNVCANSPRTDVGGAPGLLVPQGGLGGYSHG